jgi:hypothetical protein
MRAATLASAAMECQVILTRKAVLKFVNLFSAMTKIHVPRVKSVFRTRVERMFVSVLKDTQEIKQLSNVVTWMSVLKMRNLLAVSMRSAKISLEVMSVHALMAFMEILTKFVKFAIAPNVSANHHTLLLVKTAFLLDVPISKNVHQELNAFR